MSAIGGWRNPVTAARVGARLPTSPSSAGCRGPVIPQAGRVTLRARRGTCVSLPLRVSIAIIEIVTRPQPRSLFSLRLAATAHAP
jgi:hypothetical protein